MLANIFTNWLAARSEDFALPAVSDLQIILPTQTGLTATATVALSLTTLGANIRVENGHFAGDVGIVGVLVLSYIRMGPAGIEPRDVPADAAFNTIRVTRCLSVSFRTWAYLAEGYGMASVFSHSPMRVNPNTLIRQEIRVVDPPSKAIRYQHAVVATTAAWLPTVATQKVEALKRAGRLFKVRRGTYKVEVYRGRNRVARRRPDVKTLGRTADTDRRTIGTVLPVRNRLV